MKDLESLFNAFFVTNVETFALADIVWTLLMPFFLTFIIAYTYKKFYVGHEYKQEFVYSLFVFGVVAAFMTLVIGNNLARAFGLVGALSLIRFRTALKSSNDTIYLFWTLSIGMACGAGFFMAAIILTVFLFMAIWFLHKIKIGKIHTYSIVLSVTAGAKDYERLAVQIKEHLNLEELASSLINQHINSQTDFVKLNFEVHLPEDRNYQDIQEKLKEKFPSLKEIIFYNHESAIFL